MPVPAAIFFKFNLLTIYVMYSFTRHINSALAGIALMAASAMALTSCNAFDEHLEPCPEGVELRFVYDYNMEFANAFPSQVSCLTVLVYDAQGRYVTTRTVTSDVLADENWRMTIDLPAGDYRIVAYGGMACDNASFEFNPQPGADTPMESVGVELKPGMLTQPEGKALHHLFYGALDVTVKAEIPTYTAGTVEMMKDTNTLRLVLQNNNGKALKADDFIFTLTAANTAFNWQNDIVSTEPVTYWPWYTGEGYTGLTEAGNDWTTAIAELSTSRLMEDSDARLTITRASDGREVLSIPLIRFLLMLKSQEFASMQPQEFLDRESHWNMIFFLDNTEGWINTSIVINDWIVRINNAEL